MIVITGIVGIMIYGVLYWYLSDIKTELRYRNTLLKEQNEILKKERK